MQPRNPVVRKNSSPDREPDRPSRALLSVRSALVLTVALLIGFGGAALLYAAHRPVALIALGAVGFCGGALKLLDSMIELKALDPFRGSADLRGGRAGTTPPARPSRQPCHIFRHAPWRGSAFWIGTQVH